VKIEKYVEVSKVIEIDIDVADLMGSLAALKEGPLDNEHFVLSGISSVAAFMKAIPDETIALMAPYIRSVVRGFLLEQAARYGSGEGGERTTRSESPP
jgi:hypothetical protein